ncbi:MAG: hypothetical protein HN356_12210 [Calditrichaeota bacterium]|jgi:hypothetical protein|nr:hypothetical protein [Calditrichota bacterium]MBT7787671.1 hypothetical protein [Calditrichota bacterium]
MKIVLRIIGILLILLGWGIVLLLNFAYNHDNTKELQRLNWDVVEEEIKDDVLNGRLYFTANAAVTTPFWRQIAWAQKLMDSKEQSDLNDIVLEKELQDGAYCTGVFYHDGSHKINWYAKKDTGLEEAMINLIDTRCPLESDSTNDATPKSRKHVKAKLVVSFHPDTVSAYKALNLIVLNDDITANSISAVVHSFDYDYVIDQTKSCLNYYWPPLLNLILLSEKGIEYGVRIREGEKPIFTWGYPDSIMEVEHSMNLNGEIRKKVVEEKVAKGKNALFMFGRPARLYIDWGTVARSQGDLAKLMGKMSGEKLLSRLAIKANLGTSILMTLGLILILVSMRRRKKE